MTDSLAYLRELTERLVSRHGVLIVEDDPGFADYLSRLLLALRYEREHVGTGEEAIASTEEKCPAVAVVDLRLPGVNGIETIRQMRKRCPGTQFIIATSFPDEQTAIDAANLKLAGYIVKGHTYDENIDLLLQAIYDITRAREL